MSDDFNPTIEIAKDSESSVKFSDASAALLSSIELPIGAAKAPAKSSSDNDVFAKLEISDSSKIKFEGDWRGAKVLEAKERPLSRTEQLLVRNMSEALNAGDMSRAQDMLGAINENPSSVDRVMKALKSQMEAETPTRRVAWEQGKDSDGNSFTRMHMWQNTDRTKGYAEVTIGSDGRNSAREADLFHQISIEPSFALRNFSMSRNTTTVQSQLRELGYKR